MLSEGNAKLICDVGPGAPMQEAFKQFWLPVLRSERVKAGGAPIKITMLGENYVVFRGENGDVAVLDERCPHRRCSLELANAQDNSLVCMFHGWKFHTSGKCIETPNEPDPAFPAKVPLRSFQVVEAGDAIWAYFGKGEAPPFPDLIFNRLPSDRLYTRVAICDFNWLSGLDAILDPSHVGLLHRDWVEAAPNDGYSADIGLMSRNLAPRLEFEETPYGFHYAAIRDLPDGTQYIRVSEVVFPSGVFIANSRDTRKMFIMSVPIDNFRSAQWYFWHSPDETMPAVDRRYAVGATDLDDDNFYQSPKKLPLWGQDRAAMERGESFTGFNDIMFEDLIVGEAQGAFPDRSKEFLGSADGAIMYARKLILRKLRQMPQEGPQSFRHGNDADYPAIQAITAQAKDGVDWKAVARARAKERADKYELRAAAE